MIALFKGLGILLRDNELYSSPFDKQVAHWRNLSEQQIRDEVAVLAQAKCQWLIASIVGWQAASLLILGLIANYLWRDDFHITFTRVVVVFGSWVSILFVIWFMANMFDQQAGFERWMKAFNSRARITSSADSVECVADALGMTRVFVHPLAGVLSAYGRAARGFALSIAALTSPEFFFYENYCQKEVNLSW